MNRDIPAMSRFKPPPLVLGSCFDEAEVERARVAGRLLSVSLLLSNACNLKCLYCYRDAGTHSDCGFSLRQWEEVLRQAQELGARSVWIPGSGEPLLDPVFCEGHSFPLLKLCNSLGLRVTFFTNGTALTARLADALKDHDVSVVTKLNSLDPTIQDFLAGVPGAYGAIRRGLDLLLSAGFTEGPVSRLGIDTVVVSQNYQEIPAIYRFCRDHNIIPYITANLHGGRACTHSCLDVSQDDLRQLFEELLAIDRQEYGFDWFPAPPIAGGQCKKLFYDIVVDATGDVLICPGINLPLGNIRERPLAEILSSSSLFAQVRRMPDTLTGKCRQCSSKSCAYGCRLEAWAAGDLFGDDPMCWHQPRDRREETASL